jgi:hypothetical protein
MGTRARKWDAKALPSFGRIVQHGKPYFPYLATDGRASNGGDLVRIPSCTSCNRNESVGQPTNGLGRW